MKQKNGLGDTSYPNIPYLCQWAGEAGLSPACAPAAPRPIGRHGRRPPWQWQCRRARAWPRGARQTLVVMQKIVKLLILLFIMAVNIGCTEPQGEARCRPAAVAGQFYPAAADTLRAEVEGFIGMAGCSARGDVQAVIAPHAGYVFSGRTAGLAFARISPATRYERIFLLGPSHRAAFDGVSVELGYGAYATPLGRVAVDTAVCRSLAVADSLFDFLPEAHQGEHCLEVQLPFLQVRLDSMPPVVPLIVGTADMGKLRRVADALRPYFTAANLFVVSSDFSHYPAYADAVEADRQTADAVLTASAGAFVEALAGNARRGVRNLYTSACGQSPIAVLLMLMEGRPDLCIKHLGYSNSGDSPYGDTARVVGYHAFAAVGRGASAGEPLGHGRFALTRAEKSALLAIARQSIADSLAGRRIRPVDEALLTPALKARCGAFVTLSAGGRLRGCIGNLVGRRPLWQTVGEMARAAAFDDPRFSPVGAAELPGISIEVSVLSPLRRVASEAEVELGRHGILIVKGGRSGTFLPQVATDTGWTREEFLGHCSRDKAGLGWDGWRAAELYVYEADVFGED